MVAYSHGVSLFLGKASCKCFSSEGLYCQGPARVREWP